MRRVLWIRGDDMKQITFVTRVRMNGAYREESEIPPDEVKMIIQKRIEAALERMNYERKAAG